MTWTAGELVNELRHLDPDTDVYIVPGPPDIARLWRRRGWFHRRARAARSQIIRCRVVRFGHDKFAYLEGDAP